MCPKDADRITNIADPDQTVPQEESDVGLYCLPRPVGENIRIITVHELCGVSC